MKFKVDRKTWYRGRGSDNSRLLCKDGMRCCVGFYAQACRVPDEQLLDATTLQSWSDHNSDSPLNDAIHPSFVCPMNTYEEVLVDHIYSVNDTVRISDEEREKKLKDLFLKLDIEIEFEG